MGQVLNAVEADQVRVADDVRLRLAKVDPNTFLEYVLQDEETGRGVTQTEAHCEWQNLITDNKRVLIWSSVESGKTQQLVIGRTLFQLGADPTLRCVIVSNTHDQAGKLLRSISKYIVQSEELHQVFPELVPGETWTGSQLVIRRGVRSKDPSVQAFGVHGAILGARIDWLILDDILDFENTRTAGLRQELWDWYHATLAGRLTNRAKVIIVGTAFHPEDMLHKLSANPAWVARRYPIFDPATGDSRWPDRWPMKRIEDKREELGPLEFARQMLCQARDDSTARFQRAWIEVCTARGRGKRMLDSLGELPKGCRAYTGVDLAVQRNAKSDKSVLFTILVHQDGTREVINIDSGKWAGPEILNKIIDVHRRFNSILFVENNAAQDFILQFTRERSAVPVRPFTTGRNKSNPEFGVESIAAEMSGGKWIIPSGPDGATLEPEVAAWVTEMLYYDPNAHTGDRLMASWFAREGSRQGDRKIEVGFIDLMSR